MFSPTFLYHTKWKIVFRFKEMTQWHKVVTLTKNYVLSRAQDFILKTYVIFCPAIKLSKRKPLVLYLYLNTSNYAQKYFYIHKNDENLANLCFNLSHVPNKLIQERKLSNDIISPKTACAISFLYCCLSNIWEERRRDNIMRRRVSKNGRRHQQQKLTQNNALSKVGDTSSLH